MRLSVAIAAVSLCLLGLSMADDVRAAIRKPTDIPAQALTSALEQLAKDRNFQVVYVSEDIGNVHTTGAVGEFTPEEALKKLLSGTGLTYRYLDEKTVTIVPAASTRAQVEGQGGATSNAQEGKKGSSGNFRVARVDQGKAASGSSVEKQNEQASKKKPIVLEEIVITGSRIPRAGREGAQEVKIYTRESIEQSGQATVTDFLNTLPEVSVSLTENGIQTPSSGTTVRLHGLPIGTTLVLLNGRRVETSGTADGYFDLNNLPLAAVERVEVVSEGSSAVYGSDALAGVVNIILKNNFDGVEFNTKYGSASALDEWHTSIAAGARWNRGSVSLIASFQSREELRGSERPLTANNDYRPYGGFDFRANYCNPGNVFSTNGNNLPGVGAPFAAVPAGFVGTPTQQEFAATAGRLNSCSYGGYNSLIPATRRAGVLAQGSYNAGSSVELFTELMFSHVEEFQKSSPPLLFGLPGFQSFTVAASNPYNPFGEVVGIADLLTSLGRQTTDLDTEFFRALAGARGNVFDNWHWEVAAWDSWDRSNVATSNFGNSLAIQAALNSTSPAAALNPFVAGAQGSPQLLQSLVFDLRSRASAQTLAANGFVRGPIAQLPSGAIEAVVGSEYDRDKLYTDTINSPFQPPNTQTDFHRNSYAFFGEAKIPILANHSNPEAGDTLATTIAGRYDRYSDFGSKTTPQFAAEWRPVESLLVRGTYGRAFRAPNLVRINAPVVTFTGQVIDPLRGGQAETPILTIGGNRSLQPETGHSHTVGFVYAGRAVPDLQLSITHWRVDEANSIQQISPQILVNNEQLFPANVIRASNCLGGPPCPITQVNATYVNFGELDVRGLDYQLRYRISAGSGDLSPSLTATQTYHYSAALQPGVALTDRVSKANDDGNFAPRWKAIAALGWKVGPYAASLAGRYLGHYQDYNSTNDIGNFWFYDANFRCAIGQIFVPTGAYAKDAYVEVGGVNIFNRLPRYSNYLFGSVGYDPTETDIRGRFLYVQLGVKL